MSNLKVKKFELIQKYPPKVRCSVDWTLCILCQTQSTESLACQGNSNRPTTKGYETLSSLLQAFHDIDKLPGSIMFDQINDGSRVAQTKSKNVKEFSKKSIILVDSSTTKLN